MMIAIPRLPRFPQRIWQQNENTIIFFYDKGIQENGPCDSAGNLLYHLLDNSTAKTMSNQDDVFQLVLLNVCNNRGHTVSMGNYDTCRPRTMSGERRCICTMTLCGKMVT